MTTNARRILTFLLPWLTVTAICWIFLPLWHVSAIYFIRSFSVLAGLAMSALYFAGRIETHNQRKSMQITLSVIGIKVLGSVVIFLYYFAQNNTGSKLPLVLGAITYIIYSLLTVGYGYYWSLKK